MLNMIKGCTVPDARALREEYQATKYGFIANVNMEKIGKILLDFIAAQKFPLFFILELPSEIEREKRLSGKDNTAPLHKNVYYIDGLDNAHAVDLLEKYGALLINDGLCTFGFGVHDGTAEIMCEKYNVVCLHAKQSNKYADLFSKNDIPLVEKVTTAWDTFTLDTPGTSEKITIRGKTVYDILKELESWGIYFAEERET